MSAHIKANKTIHIYLRILQFIIQSKEEENSLQINIKHNLAYTPKNNIQY